MRIVNLDGELHEFDDYRDRLLCFVPALLTIIKKDSKEDRSIQRAFLQRFITIERAINDTGMFEAEPCFWDVLFRAEEGNQNDKALLFFLNNALKQIYERLNLRFRAQIKTMVRNLFCNFDDEKSRLYSGIAEVATLCKILESEELTLKGIEQKMPNGKSVDFVIEQNSEDFFVEVVSISFAIERTDSWAGMFAFLRKRIETKFEDKYQHLDASYLRRASLLAVLWGDTYNLKKYWDALLRIDKAYSGTVFPFYCLYYHAGRKEYVYVPVNGVFRYAKS